MRKGLTFASLSRNTDIVITFLIVAVILMMIVPIPPSFMDLLLAFNISLSLIMFLISLYTLKPLDFSIFPSLLLISTLFRLSLNISTTRLILTGGFAGQVIETFGNFVIGGNLVVGLVVFLILVVVNFIVITQGANRVAEVAARFTLDAMPGKQMAVDADLNAGAITEEEAKIERGNIAKQADFYGAMDGASKFVKGDAIVGIIIVLINVVGGLAIGVLQQGMDINEALQRYSLLAVGDGLVSQIPALLISVATGMVVTRAASDSNLSQQLSLQFLAQPRALSIAAGVIFLLGFLSGMPKVPFFLIGGLLGIVSVFQLRKMKKEKAMKQQLADDEEREAITVVDEFDEAIRVDLVEVELGYGLISIVDSKDYGNLTARIDLVRKQIITETGFVAPPIRIRDNMQISDNHYRIKIKGVEIAENELNIDSYLILNPSGEEFEIDGVDTQEPVYALDARWISASNKDIAEAKGYTVIDPVSLLVTHLTEVLKEYSSEIFGLKDAQKFLDKLKEVNSVVVDEVLPNLISLSDFHMILKNLLKERIPIKDLTSILETISSKAKLTKNIDYLTEFVRQGLARSITKMFENPPGVLSVIVVDPEIEQKILESTHQTEHGSKCVIDPEYVKDLIAKIEDESKRVSSLGYMPIVICLSPVRQQIRQISDRVKPKVVVLSYDEIIQDIKIEPIGILRFRDFQPK